MDRPIITLSRAALIELLTTAAGLGRDMQDAGTRGDITALLASYGLSVDSSRLDEAVHQAERATQ